MTDRRAEGEAVACRHEPFEGRCVHCNVRFVDGQPANVNATLSAQLAEARRQRDDYAAMWESNAMATAAAANRALTAEERLAEERGKIELMREALQFADKKLNGWLDAEHEDVAREAVRAALSPRDADAAALQTEDKP